MTENTYQAASTEGGNSTSITVNKLMEITGDNMTDVAFIALMIAVVLLMGMLTYMRVHRRNEQEIEQTTVTVTKSKTKSRRK